MAYQGDRAAGEYFPSSYANNTELQNGPSSYQYPSTSSLVQHQHQQPRASLYQVNTSSSTTPQGRHITDHMNGFGGEQMNGYGINRAGVNANANNLPDRGVHMMSPSQMGNGAPQGQRLQQSAYTPAQLLNPRGYQAAPTQQGYQNGNGFTPNFSPGDAMGRSNSNMAFQFDSPGGSPAPTYKPQAQQFTFDGGRSSLSGNGSSFAPYTNGNGMGHMLERVHGVADRASIPAKRRKIQDDREEQKKAEFSGGGGKGGVIGEYMRAKKAEGVKEATSQGMIAVSLDDDEDEVVEIVDKEDQEVCYGRIEGASINAHKVPTPKEGTVVMSPNFWPQIKIVLRRRFNEKTNCINVVDATRQIIGCIDVTTAIGLTPILDSKFGIRTVGRILTRPRKDGDAPPGSDCSCKYGLDLNIYGPRKYAMQIGTHLSQKQVYLRTPMFVEAGVELFNPHAIQKPAMPLQKQQYTSYGSRQAGPARTQEEIRNDVMTMFDSLTQTVELPQMDADPRITTPLLMHQKQGLYFMTNKEKVQSYDKESICGNSLWKTNISASGARSYMNVITGQEEYKPPPQILGGILADMMGLGKTLSILSLVMQTLDTEAVEWSKLEPCSQDAREVCPSRNSTKKKALPSVGETPLKSNAKTTLLISPLSTIQNWEEQIKQHIKPGALNYYIYHGNTRIKDYRRLAEFDLVITTYGAVSNEFGARSKKKNGVYPLDEINWYRIVLDEAHTIREQTTQTSKGVCRLAANRRWAVTGTPVQNRLEDLGALMTFLRIKPFDQKGGFAQHIMAPFKMCDPEILPKLRLLVDSITLRRLKDRINLPKRTDTLVKLDFNPEERRIYEVFAKNASDRVKVIVGQRDTKLGGKSYVHILQSILRLRLICAHGKDLLNEEDLKVMNGLSKDSAIDLDSDDDDETFGLSAKQAYNMYSLMKQTNADTCGVCFRKISPNDAEDDGESKDQVIGQMTPCYHIICPGCFPEYRDKNENMAQGHSAINCPLCQAYIKLAYFPLKMAGVEDEEQSRTKSRDNAKNGKDLSNYSGPHTKTLALVADLLKSAEESKSLPPGEHPIKSVVFSGWTSHLDLIALALDAAGINHVRLDGKMTRVARTASMDRFRDDASITVILVSIMAGGLGLNLTTGSKVYVMEPQYNPQAEAQAVDRVHRLGQKREVTTVRYVMSDSFEEKMLELQEKKKKLAHLSMDSDGRARPDKAEAARKRLEDLRSLFK